MRSYVMELATGTDGFAKWLFLFSAVFWLGLVALKSLGGGWHRLATRFRTSDRPRGATYRFASVYIRAGALPVSYANCVMVTVNPSGVRLAVFFPFRFMHPPLFIPWSAVETVMPEDLASLRYVAVRIRGVDTRLLFIEPVGRKLVEAFNARYATIIA